MFEDLVNLFAKSDEEMHIFSQTDIKNQNMIGENLIKRYSSEWSNFLF